MCNWIKSFKSDMVFVFLYLWVKIARHILHQWSLIVLFAYIDTQVSKCSVTTLLKAFKSINSIYKYGTSKIIKIIQILLVGLCCNRKSSDENCYIISCSALRRYSQLQLKVKVCVYTPDIPAGSVQFTLISPSYWNSLFHCFISLGRIQHIIQQL